MARTQPRNIVASVRDRLVAQAKSRGTDPNLILLWYGIERFLYRLSLSPYRDRFVLKGAMLFKLWDSPEFRATKDLDLLGFVRHETEALRQVVIAICEQPVEDDGLVFDSRTLRIEQIRESQEYGGLRVCITARLGTALVPLQIDVGFGDAITPAAMDAEFPSLLDQPRPRVRAYPRETVVAEKYEAMVQLGMANSRMKDYFDLWFLSRQFEFDGQRVADAMRATFDRRGTPLPVTTPIGLSDDFASDAAHSRQWKAFTSRIAASSPENLNTTILRISAFVQSPSEAARTSARFPAAWRDGRWRH